MQIIGSGFRLHLIDSVAQFWLGPAGLQGPIWEPISASPQAFFQSGGGSAEHVQPGCEQGRQAGRQAGGRETFFFYLIFFSIL